MRISDWSSDVCSSDLLCDLAQNASALASCTLRVGGRRQLREGARRVAQSYHPRWARIPQTCSPSGNVVRKASEIPGPNILTKPDSGHSQTDADTSNSPSRSTLELVGARSEEHTSELQSLMRISYAVFCLKKNIEKYSKKYPHSRSN